jgi:hypothetical protein
MPQWLADGPTVRSNVESTFSMVESKFLDSLRSKTDTAMRNELASA